MAQVIKFSRDLQNISDSPFYMLLINGRDKTRQCAGGQLSA